MKGSGVRSGGEKCRREGIKNPNPIEVKSKSECCGDGAEEKKKNEITIKKKIIKSQIDEHWRKEGKGDRLGRKRDEPEKK